MELLYIWIESYKNIHHQGFNFSPKYRFDFNSGTNELSCVENEDALPDDFFGKNISNITAIVGENGSGKSSLFEFIINSQKNYKNINTVIIFNGLIIPSRDLSVNLINKTNTNFEIKQMTKYENEKGFPIHVSWKDFIHNYDIVYYSQSLDNRILTDSFLPYYIDISNKYLLDQMKRQVSILNWNASKLNREDLKWQLIFIEKFSLYKSLSFLPNKLIICPEYFIAHPYYANMKHKEELNSWGLFSFINEKNFYDNINSENFEKQLLMLLILNIFKVAYDKKIKINNNLSFKDIDDIIELGRNVISEEFCIKLLRFWNYLIAEVLPNFEYERNHGFDMPLSPNNYIIIKNILLLYNDITEISEFLVFRWLNLSAGEISFLNLFSRYISIIDALNPNVNYLFLLIDEGEHGLHPQWQKEFVSNIINIFPEIFKDKKLQIILTSHSPFVCSDLPKENIIFLERYKETDIEIIAAEQKAGHCKVIDSQKMEKTFGQNIHTLLSNSFFLKDGLMGEFAKGKINDILDFIKNSEKNTEKIKSKEDCKKMINIIGEDFLREKIIQMFHEKFPKTKEEKIKELSEQIEKLKNDTNSVE